MQFLPMLGKFFGEANRSREASNFTADGEAWSEVGAELNEWALQPACCSLAAAFARAPLSANQGRRESQLSCLLLLLLPPLSGGTTLELFLEMDGWLKRILGVLVDRIGVYIFSSVQMVQTKQDTGCLRGLLYTGSNLIPCPVLSCMSPAW